MLAHLQAGRLGNARILSEETTQFMHTRQFTHHPKLPGCAVSFMEYIINERRLIGHDGNWRGFTSSLVLDPDAELGFFVSYNALSSAGTENGLHMDLVDAFYDRYFPKPRAPLPAPAADALSRAGLFEGSYRHNRYIRDSFGKLAALLSEWRVEANPDGTLTALLPYPFLEPLKLVEVEPLLFMRGDGKGFVAFRAGDDGRITHMFFDNFAADKLPAVETARFHILLLSTIIIVFLSALLGWPIAYVVRRPRPNHPGAAVVARWFAAVTILLFLGSLIVIFVELTGDTYEYAYGVPERIVFLLRLQYLVTALIIGMVVFAVLAWGKSWWSLSARIHYSVIAFAAVTLIPILIYWRLLGFGY